MENCGAIDQGAIVQMLVVFVQFEPTQVDVDCEVVAVWKLATALFADSRVSRRNSYA
jgi:hypothetical protein